MCFLFAQSASLERRQSRTKAVFHRCGAPSCDTPLSSAPASLFATSPCHYLGQS